MARNASEHSIGLERSAHYDSLVLSDESTQPQQSGGDVGLDRNL